jgi:hypothetical protein
MAKRLGLDESVAVSGLCPYSEETVAGCRYYRPISAHGDFPEAAHCAEASALHGSSHIRHTICRRRAPWADAAAAVRRDDQEVNLGGRPVRRGLPPSNSSR